MTTRYILSFVCVLALSSCKTEKKDLKYTLVQDNDNITVEQFDVSVDDENKYNYNNVILQPGHTFTYQFVHIDTNGVEKYYKTYINGDEQEWDFVSSEDIEAIKQFRMKASSGNSMAKMIPDYNQTNIQYYFGDSSFYSLTGGIENEANYWIHPPREAYFKILELNPFPYIRAPYKVGTQWTWSLAIGSSWGDPRWATWEGNIKHKYNYEITSKQTIETALGSLECYEVIGLGNGPLGTTKLVSYFNETYGFVKLNYTNIDGSQTKITLVEFND